MLGHGAEHGVTGVTPEDMVDVAEFQDVDVHAAERAAGPQLRKLFAQDPAQSHQVGQAGHLVAFGDFLESGGTPCVGRHLVHADLEAATIADAGLQNPHAVLTGTGQRQLAVVMAALAKLCQQLLGHGRPQQCVDVRRRLAGQVAAEGIGRALVPALQRAVGVDAQQGHGRRVVDAVQCARCGVHLDQVGLEPVLAPGGLLEEAGDPDHQPRAHHHLEPGGVQERIGPGALNEADVQDHPAQQGTGHAQATFQSRVLAQRDDDLDHQHHEQQARNDGGQHVRPVPRQARQCAAQGNGQGGQVADEPGEFVLPRCRARCLGCKI